MENKGHQLSLADRKELTVTGVKHVLSYDDQEVSLETTMGGLILKGEGLNVRQLDIENSKLVVVGRINVITYGNVDGKGKGKAVWQRLWK